MKVSFEVLDFNTLEDTIEMLGRKGYKFYNSHAFLGPRLEHYKEALDPVFLCKGMYLIINDNKTFEYKYYLEPRLYPPLQVFGDIKTLDGFIIIN